MNIQWRDAGRHYLQVVAFCCVIAVLTTLLWPRRAYLPQWGYALTIGTVCWLVVEFGRYAVDKRHCHPSSTGAHGWPQGWRGLLLTTLGIACSVGLGMPLAEWLFGDGHAPSARDSGITLSISILAGGLASFYFHARGKAANLIAQKNAAERDASEAKLRLLETQLAPHMLFNTLANLRALITLDPPRAVTMLDRLNSYLRVTLNGSRALSHPLSAEFSRLGDYLELMAVRLGPRLRFTLDLPAALREIQVPPLLLQPLVENAIRHGIEPQVQGGEITVSARFDGLRLTLEVCDTGAGLAPAAVPSEGGGFGLAQVRERLATVHGNQGVLRLTPLQGGGCCASISFPVAP